MVRDIYGYGAAAAAGPKQSSKRSISAPIFYVLISLFAPWFVFVIVFALTSFSLRYSDPALCWLLVTLIALGLAMLAGTTGFKLMRAVKVGARRPAWLMFVCVSLALALSLGVFLGNRNFQANIKGYYDAMRLNSYTSVDPATWTGQQVMDAGQVHFTDDVVIDRTHSGGFMDQNMYCVAPIVSGTTTLPVYDFWAVGINCCSGNPGDFHCGEFSNLQAHSGLRVTREDEKTFFSLAAQQAGVTHNLKVTHPIFLTWMQDPSHEINAFENGGVKYFLVSIFAYFWVQVLMVIIASVASWKGAL